MITDSETYGKFLTNQTTTSKSAKWKTKGNRTILQEVEKHCVGKKTDERRESNVEKENEKDIIHNIPKHIYIHWWKDRRLDNFFLSVIYRFIRMFVVSIWFYFVPFIAVIASFLIPLLMRKYEEPNPSSLANEV